MAALAAEREFDGMEAEWNDLLLRTRAPNIFLSWEWLHGWWRRFRRKDWELFLVLARAGSGALVGILPCYKAMGPVGARIRFLGSEVVCSDYLDLLAEGGREGEVGELLFGFLRQSCTGVARFEFTDVRPDSIAASLLLPAFDRSGFRYTVGRMAVCPQLALPGSLEDLRNAFTANLRSNIRRKVRAFFSGPGASVRIARTGEELDAAFDSLFRLHTARWASKGESGVFCDEGLNEFHREFGRTILGKGWIRMYVLEYGHRPVAVHYCLEFGGRFTFYQGGIDPDSVALSPGFVLHAVAVEDAVRSGNSVYDFLRGVEDYKLRWTKDSEETLAIRIYPGTIPGRVALWKDRTIGTLRAIKRRVAPVG